MANTVCGCDQVYSAELVQAMGSASQRLMQGMQDAFAEPQNPASATTHLAQHAWVLSLFILLQSPLNGESHGLGYALLGSIAQVSISRAVSGAGAGSEAPLTWCCAVVESMCFS